MRITNEQPNIHLFSEPRALEKQIKAIPLGCDAIWIKTLNTIACIKYTVANCFPAQAAALYTLASAI